MINKRERVYQAFGGFVHDLVRDLNHMSEDGWALFVEGHRDQKALRALGYTGHMVTVSMFSRRGIGSLGGAKKVIILTDLDREGRTLASRSVRKFAHEGIQTSLSERRRLKAGSRGVFLHIEGLIRFAERDDTRVQK